MKETLSVFFVNETEYAKLQKLSPSEFTNPYSEYSAYVIKRNRQISDRYTAVKADVKVNEFVTWCAAAKVKPDATARSAYAAMCVARGQIIE